MLSKTIPRELPIPIEDFTSKYGVGKGALWVKISQDKLPREVMIGKGIVNHSWFLRRWQFQNYVKEANQSLVYLLEENFSLSEIAKTITSRYGGNTDSIREFMDKGLFALQGEDIKIATKVHKNSWLVFKYFKAVERRLKRKGTSIEKILTQRTEEYERMQDERTR